MNKSNLYLLLLFAFLCNGCNVMPNHEKVDDRVSQQAEYVINNSLSSTTYSGIMGISPKDGFVPTAELAIRLAKPILCYIYGEEAIKREMPFSVNLEDDVWIIEGHLEPELKGGVVYMEMCKSTGEILKVTHTE